MFGSSAQQWNLDISRYMAYPINARIYIEWKVIFLELYFSFVLK